MVIKYENLEKLYYKYKNIDEEYEKRIKNNSTIVTDLMIYSEYKKNIYPYFFVFYQNILNYKKIYIKKVKK